MFNVLRFVSYFSKRNKKKPDRVSHYNKYVQKYDWSNITFPINLHNLKKVENFIDHGINVFGYDKENNKFYPLQTTKRKDENKIINLLLIADETKKHYVFYIRNLDVLLMPNKKK